MNHPVEAWHAEHVEFLRQLALLQRETDAFQAGAVPDYRRMLEVVAYLREFSDACHHPREDEAFRRLLRYQPERELPIARLHQEHRVIAHAGETLRQLLEGAFSGEVVPRAEIEAAASTYLVYYRAHIAREEDDVLPRAAQLLTPEDWQAVKAAAPTPRVQPGLPSSRGRVSAPK